MEIKKASIPLIFVASFLLFIGAIFGLKKLMFGKLTIAPEVTLGKPLPEGMQIISSLKVDHGSTLSFYNPLAQHRISLTRSTGKSLDAAPTGELLVDAVIKFQQEQVFDQGMSDLSLRFLSAEVNGRRAKNITTSQTSNGTVFTSFETNNKAHYSIAIVRSGEQELLVMIYRKDQPVDAGYAEEVLKLIS